MSQGLTHGLDKKSEPGQHHLMKTIVISLAASTLCLSGNLLAQDRAPSPQADLQDALQQIELGKLPAGWKALKGDWGVRPRQQRVHAFHFCVKPVISFFAATGTIALLYPNLLASAAWLRSAQSDLPNLLFTEFGIAGGYGKGSLHYPQ